MEVEEFEMQKSILSASAPDNIEGGGDMSTGEGQTKPRSIWGNLWYENQEVACAEQLIFSCSWWSVGNLSADLFVFPNNDMY